MSGVSGSTNCKAPYWAFPIKNNTIGDGVALNRGLPVSIGGQPQGMRLTFFWNNTIIENGEDCRSLTNGASNATSCVGRSGGVFFVEKSPTWKAAPDGGWNGSTIDPVNNATYQETSHILRGWDTATFSGDIQVPGYPLALWTETYISNRTALGLGSNDSSTIKAFVKAGLFDEVPGEVGIFMASRSELHSTDGEIVFGGYDTSRVNGSFTWFPIGNRFAGLNCPFQVLVDGATLVTSNSSNSLLPSSGFSKIPFCIDPVQNAFTFTQEMWQTWTNLTKHPKATDDSPPYTEQTYPWSSESLMGELQIKMSNDQGQAYTSTIPHFEMVSHERYQNSKGLYTVTNTSRAMSAVVSPEGGMLNVPLLGGVFLSQNYMVIDWAAGRFGLAPASIQPWDSSKRNIAAFCSNPPKKSSHTTAIAVSVVLGSLLLISALLLAWFWRRRKSRKSQAAELEALAVRSDPTNPFTGDVELSDKSAHEFPCVHEADSSLAPIEMDGTDAYSKGPGDRKYELASPT